MQVFEKDAHQIILGDAVTVLEKLVPNNSVDLIFADPPYNRVYQGLLIGRPGIEPQAKVVETTTERHHHITSGVFP